jgi:hypothetical protein
MTAKARICAQSPLQIYTAVLSQIFQIGAGDCFLEQIKAHPIRATGSKRQAATI